MSIFEIFKALELLKYPEPIIDNNASNSYFEMTFELAGVHTKVADQTPTKYRSTDQVMTLNLISWRF